MKRVLVTGASSGIGLALCKLLVRDHGCYVYLGSRNADKGQMCLESILQEVPAAKGKIEVVSLDVTDDASVTACVGTLKTKGVALYGLVNNAGVGLAQRESASFDLLTPSPPHPANLSLLSKRLQPC
jgi:carbonyl reductase 1